MRGKESESILPMILVALSTGMIMGGLTEFLYIYVYEVHNMSKSLIGLVLFTAGIISLISSILMTYIADKFSIQLAMNLVILIGLPSLVILTTKTSSTLVIVSIVMVSICVKALRPLLRSLAIEVMPKFKGLGVGIANAFDNIGVAIALIYGLIYDIFDEKKVMLGSITLILGGLGYLIPFTLLLIVIIYNIITKIIIRK